MNIAPEILELLRCPITGSPLSIAEPGLIEKINHQAELGQVETRIKTPVKNALVGGLINNDATFLVAVYEDEIPVLVADEMIPLEHLKLDE